MPQIEDTYDFTPFTSSKDTKVWDISSVTYVHTPMADSLGARVNVAIILFSRYYSF